MDRWLDWLDEMAPEWEFSYPEHKHTTKGKFDHDLRHMQVTLYRHLNTDAHLKVQMTKDHMVLHKLAWNVVKISTEEYDTYT